MKSLKGLFLSGVIACAALIGGVAALPVTEKETAVAETAQTYETKDVYVMARITNVYVPNGNFNLTLTLSDYDTGIAKGGYEFDKDLASAFEKLGFFDNIKFGEKSLREYGCVGFWDNAADINVNEPKPVINLHCHADPTLWKEAYDNGEIAFSSSSCPVTITEGTMIPGFGYLTGESASIVYRASHTFVSTPKSGIAYDMETYVQAEVESVKYTTDWDATYNNAYFGVSFVGDDYLGDGEQVEIVDYTYDNFTKSFLVNGENGKVESYGLYNLGDAGKGYYSFVIRVPASDCVSITIPKGSLFPTRMTKTLRDVNGHDVYFYYQTTSDVTFYKSADGAFVSLDAFRAEKLSVLQEMRAAKADAEYFSADVAVMNALMTEYVGVIESATDVNKIQEAFDYAKGVLEGIMPKTDAVNAAKAELDGYKAAEIYFTDADAATKASIIQEAKAAVDSAASSEAITVIVEGAKTAVDALPSKGGAIAAATEELNGYKAEENYFREAEATQRAEIIASALAEMDGATSAAQIEEITAAAKVAIDGLTTNAEYTAVEEEIAANRAAALAVVNTAKAGVETWRYTQTDLTTIDVLYANAKKAINGATEKAVMDEAAADFVAKIATILPRAEENTEKKSGGCGSFVGVDVVCLVIGLLSVATVCKKKEN